MFGTSHGSDEPTYRRGMTDGRRSIPHLRNATKVGPAIHDKLWYFNDSVCKFMEMLII